MYTAFNIKRPEAGQGRYSVVERTRWRRDGLAEGDGRNIMVWAWRLPEGLPYREGMLMLFNLVPTADQTPEIYARGMTHEFQVFEIDPATPVDFDKTLFDQKHLSPLTPACLAYQFKADSTSTRPTACRTWWTG